MGVGSSSSYTPNVPLDKYNYDETKFEYEPADIEIYDNYLYLKWNCVPEPIKQQLVIEVIKTLSLEDLDTINEIFFEKAFAILQYDNILKRRPGICVSYKWAILEALKHLNIKRKFVLQKHGFWWHISFIYDLSDCQTVTHKENCL